jgi:hypothetical protein
MCGPALDNFAGRSAQAVRQPWSILRLIAAAKRGLEKKVAETYCCASADIIGRGLSVRAVFLTRVLIVCAHKQYDVRIN